MQESQPLAYFSKSLGPKVAAQSVYEKEAMAILQALKKWRHYFLGNKVIIKSYQQSLKYLGGQRLLEGIQHKLMLKLLEFDYTIEYKKGSQNKVADALSRKDQTAESCLATSTAKPSWTIEVETSYLEDPKSMQLLQELSLDSNSGTSEQSWFTC